MDKRKKKSLIFIGLMLVAGLVLGQLAGRVEGLVKGILIVFLVILTVVLLLGLWAYLKRDKGLEALQGCEPDKAIAINEKKIAALRAKPMDEKHRFQLNLHLNNLAVAYHALGEIEKAAEILREVDTTANSKSYESMFVVTYHNMAYYYLELGRLEEYEECYNALIDFLAKLPADKAKQYGGIFEHLEAKKEMLEGSYKKCADYYATAVEQEDEGRQTLLSRVITRFELGVIYKEAGEVGAAIEQLEFVARHGKNIHVAQEARKMLEELKSQ